jgi:hypothetical protein
MLDDLIKAIPDRRGVGGKDGIRVLLCVNTESLFNLQTIYTHLSIRVKIRVVFGICTNANPRRHASELP